MNASPYTTSKLSVISPTIYEHSGAPPLPGFSCKAALLVFGINAVTAAGRVDARVTGCTLSDSAVLGRPCNHAASDNATANNSSLPAIFGPLPEQVHNPQDRVAQVDHAIAQENANNDEHVNTTRAKTYGVRRFTAQLLLLWSLGTK